MQTPEAGGGPQPANVNEDELVARLSSTDSEADLDDMVRLIADHTGASPETLRTALRLMHEQQQRRKNWLGRFKQQVAQIDYATRRTIGSAFLGLQAALISALGSRFGDDYGLGVIAQLGLGVLALYNLALTRKPELGALAGALLGASYIIGLAFFSWLVQAPQGIRGLLIIPATILGGILGTFLGKRSDKILQLRFQHDPEKRREYLLKQLIELQEELKVGERVVTFLSVDVVGSTLIKQATEPLAAEYTFSEYTNYAKAVTAQFGGVLHSTAGDGILFTFEHPNDAFSAARRLQRGMLEFNTFRNRAGSPLSLRCGIHTGSVLAPSGDMRALSHSHVIDMAAHAQKIAPPGGIALTEDAAVFIPGGSASVGSEFVEIHGAKAFLWSPLPSEAAATSATQPPPLPLQP